jgi:hypothetical protein
MQTIKDTILWESNPIVYPLTQIYSVIRDDIYEEFYRSIWDDVFYSVDQAVGESVKDDILLYFNNSLNEKNS